MVLTTNQISFTDDELPPEGKEHTLPMHIMVKCEDMIFSSVLTDNGSTLNVCLMSVIARLNVDTTFTRPTTKIIRTFDGTLGGARRDRISNWNWPQIFLVNFQVIKVDSPYSMLLWRPWLHAVGAVASTLH